MNDLQITLTAEERSLAEKLKSSFEFAAKAMSTLGLVLKWTIEEYHRQEEVERALRNK